MKLRILLSVMLGLAFVACDSEDNDAAEVSSTENQTVVGAIFHDDTSGSAKLRLAAIQMAVDEINDADVLKQKLKLINLSPGEGDSGWSATKVTANAKKLHDDHKAVGVISLFSSIGAEIIKTTNDDAYKNMIQCNVSATSPTVNTTDTTDAFYRTVVTDFFQAKLMVKLMQDKSLDLSKVGIFHADESWGTGLKDAVLAELGADAATAWAKSHPEDSWDIAAGENQANLDAVIAANLSVLVLPTKSPASGIVKYLTENNFTGTILLADGAKSDDIFTAATGLQAWDDVAGNEILGTEPDNFGGDNSAAFSTALAAASIESNSYSPSAYDCAYALALSVAYAEQAGDVDAAAVKTAIQKFKTANRGTTETVVDIGAAGFKAAHAAIVAGDQVDFNGASGKLMFDENGDRPGQGMRTFQPSYGATADASSWANLDQYDEELAKKD